MHNNNNNNNHCLFNLDNYPSIILTLQVPNTPFPIICQLNLNIYFIAILLLLWGKE